MREELRRLSKRRLIELIIQLEERLVALEERVVDLEQRNAELEAKLAKARKNSSTSSKPPSSDIVKPRSASSSGKSGNGKIGGQPGHPLHERTPFSAEEVNDRQDYTLDRCPRCGGAVTRARLKPRVIQQVELVERPLQVVEHRAWAYWCPRCRRFHYACVPAEVRKGGLVGVRATALVGYLKGACHTSYTTIQAYLRDVLKMPLSRGQYPKLVGKVAAALEAPYAELRESLPSEACLNIDETGHKDRGERHWTWCFRARLFTLFKIDPSRGSKVLVEVLGKEFAGVIGADYFSAYHKYMGDFNVLVQFCLAHLIRDVKFLTTLPDKATRKYADRLLDRLRDLFGVIHRREELTAARFDAAIQEARKRLVAAARHPPSSVEAQNLAERFRRHGDAYFRFLTTPGIEPTNNLAEQAIRFVVIDRRVTQGTRGEAGQRWSERIWTVTATCAQQGRSVFDFLQQAVRAHFNQLPAPSLRFNSS